MLPVLLITIALSSHAPLQTPEAADAVVPNQASVSTPDSGALWASLRSQ
jgi:hypothetical protein